MKDVDLKGKSPESWFCIDCGVNTAPGCFGRVELERAFDAAGRVKQHIDDRSEIYTVHDHVWKAAGMERLGGCVCVGCLEARLGRKLIPDDFPRDRVFNQFPGTPRLLERQGRVRDVLGNIEQHLLKLKESRKAA
jgi:hypothetical protein